MLSIGPLIAAALAAVSLSTPVQGNPGAGTKDPSLPLAGKVVGIDPGHNGRNYTDPAFIDHLIWNGREREACDTTGTETDGGYTEARFNLTIFRDGKAVEMVHFPDPEDALAAAGL